MTRAGSRLRTQNSLIELFAQRSRKFPGAICMTSQVSDLNRKYSVIAFMWITEFRLSAVSFTRVTMRYLKKEPHHDAVGHSHPKKNPIHRDRAKVESR